MVVTPLHSQNPVCDAVHMIDLWFTISKLVVCSSLLELNYIEKYYYIQEMKNVF